MMVEGIAPMTADDDSSAPVDLVELSRNGAIMEVSLNRPGKLNALSGELIERLSLTLLQCERDSGVRVVVLRGKGKAFCAGGDVAALARLAKHGTQSSIHEGNKFMQRQYQLNHVVATLNKTTIAIWDGIAMGGGIGASICQDFRISTENTMIAMPECAIAFFPDVGASYFLNRLDHGIGAWLALSGSRVKGEDAVLLGLATHHVASDRLEGLLAALATECAYDKEEVDRLLTRSSSNPPTGQMHAKRARIRAIFQAGSLKEILQHLEESRETWAAETLRNIRSASPTAVCVTFELLKRTKGLKAEQCRALEFVVHTNFMRLPDFVEGTFARLIDKPARTARWSPSSIEDCTEQYVASFFIPKDAPLRLRAQIADEGRQNRYARHARLVQATP
ncbi:hypothetical protein PYCC9005_001031 [Savitreella phatthalungensis]